MNAEKETLKQRQEAFVLLGQANHMLVGMTAEFQLRSEPEWFVNWLDRRLKLHEGRLWLGNYEGQYVTLETNPITTDADGNFVLTTTGVLHDYDVEGTPIEFVPVRFEVVRGAGDYTLVTAAVKNFYSLVGELLRELMLATLERWPEAGDLLEIEKHDLHYMVDEDTSTGWGNVVNYLETALIGATRQEVMAEKATPDQPDADDASQPPEPAKEPEIRIPRQPTALNRWKLTWRLIRGQADKGAGYKEMSSWLGKMRPNLPNHPDTIRDIVIAGKAGFLDNQLPHTS